MDEQKKTNVNSASIIDLKAELARKQNEFKQQKLQSLSSSGFIKAKTAEKKPSIWSKKNAGVLQRAQKDIEQKIEDENEFEKSRKALQAKAALYEKITQGEGIPEEDGSHVYLVDFQKKVIDNIVEKREEQRKEEEEKEANYEKEFLEKAVVPNPTEEEEWVDYTDSLGRLRRCMKKDVPHLIRQDKELTGKGELDRKLPDKDEPTLLSHDMRREMLRQKWEKEEQEALNKPVGPTHYANVQFDEIRTHGVGYYQFSKDEASRGEQMETLTDLRKQTVDERVRKERLKEKRKAMLDARLAKVKQRKMMRDGGGMFGPDINKEEDEDDIKNTDEIGPSIGEAVIGPQPDTSQIKEDKKEPNLLVRDETLKQNAAMREWDKGKDNIFAREDRYFSDRRAERCEEFAPPPSYYEISNLASPQQKKWTSKKELSLQPNKLRAEDDKRNVPPPAHYHKETTQMNSSEIPPPPAHSHRVPITTQFSTSFRSSPLAHSHQAVPEISTSDIPLPEPINKVSDTAQAELTPDVGFPYKLGQQMINTAYGSIYNPNYGAWDYTSGHLNLPPSQESNILNLSGYQTNFPPPPPPERFTGSSNFQSAFSVQHPSLPGGYVPGRQYNVIDNMTNSTCATDLSKGSDYLTPVSVSEMVIPKPVKLNIVDPRFIQNQETLKTGVQNLSRSQSDKVNPGSEATSDLHNKQAECSTSDCQGTTNEGQSVFTSSPVMYKK